MATIYGQTLPRTVYKYRPIANEIHLQWLADMIVSGRFYWPTPHQFNDPFDCAPVYRRMEGRELQNCVRALVRRLNPELNRVARRARERELIKEDDSLYQERYLVVQDTIQESAVFSVSKDPHNLLMWSHYAESHQGVCLRFDADVLFDAFTLRGIMGLPVTYSEERPVVTIGADLNPQELLRRVFLVKSADWSYEREWRFLHYRGGAGERIFPPEALTGVILGARISQEKKDAVHEIVARRKSPLPILHARIDRERFAVQVG